MDITATATAPASSQAESPKHAELRAQAKALEAFLFAEMLRVSGTGTPSPTGPQDSQFDSFLRQAQSEAVAESGQTGLAESIYRSMLGRAGLSDS